MSLNPCGTPLLLVVWDSLGPTEFPLLANLPLCHRFGLWCVGLGFKAYPKP